MSLTNLVNLKERLNITGTAPADTPEDYLQSLIDRSDAMVQTVIGRTVEKTLFTEYHDGGGRYMHLRQGPIVAASTAPVLSSVTYDSAGAETLTTLDAGDYHVWGAESEVNWTLPGYIESVSGWTTGRRNYKAVYYAGWATVPSDIEEAALHVCIWMKNKRRDTATSDRTVGDGTMGGFATMNDLMRELRGMLAAYIPMSY